MKIIETGIDDLIVLEPVVFGDERGYFYESFNENVWKEKVGKVPNFVQDNESMSHRGVLRGLHFQKPPFAQAKLVRVVAGSAIDVAVDIRKNSSTYGQSFSVKLTAENKKQMFVPEGFAHGFVTLEDNTIFSYKCTNYYNKESEDGLQWNDSSLNINWEINDPILSEKDKSYKSFINFATPFD
ncbi:dTDP-4-dehydrorhamnose 3,5-epimerase [Brumimicrobium aurantiacum]|uniref:dTDP-4-dehydrorhamnose 3,5-epimerase n=1 Tax=Brumimicrobium aurantiacum TaxID=1737063 RepID=A0A3E1F2C7_9FLAO|nr:dTDP-4-dehydrorhamnose 3,5-epimerase [Brumimicrobium aurantiacum]RFC55978.1 dTDP-4-dehydrorhamnose 3,5-epimerase [Brumimicrobium aurantiacum]